MIYYCPKCDVVCPSFSHVCKDEDIIAYIELLKKSANDSEQRQRKVADAVLVILEAYPEEILNKNEKIEVSSDFFRKLWDACELRFYNDLDIDSHLGTWMSYQWLVTCTARLFKSKSRSISITSRQKLQDILTQLQKIWEHKGWKDTLDISVNDLIIRLKKDK